MLEKASESTMVIIVDIGASAPELICCAGLRCVRFPAHRVQTESSPGDRAELHHPVPRASKTWAPFSKS
ncbi:Voltage-Dependent P/Q-Type Calcium Channel Subunit Alpha-1A [Manis pentadactyla]|nr:Voltage-Dependent P/Q-Type Calcium Channel Subunit Alpha-1A [Manis pentadactyla]